MDNEEKATISRRGVTTTGHPMAWELYCCRNKDRVPMQVTTVAFNTPGTMITAHLALINTRDDDMEDAIEADFEAMIAGFDFAGEGVRPALPPLAAGDEPLRGLYLNVASELALNPFGGTDYKVNMNTLFFDADGRFADEPPAGADDLDAFCNMNAAPCGVYRREGGDIVMRKIDTKFGLVEETRESFAHDGEALVIDEASYRPVAPVSDLKLDGTWSYFWASTGTIGTSSNAMSSVHTLTLTRDGRFKRSGFASMSSNIETGDTNTSVTGSSDKPEETGTYAIDGYTMTLTVDGAGPEVKSIYLPDAGDIDLLMIDGNSYLREGRD